MIRRISSLICLSLLLALPLRAEVGSRIDRVEERLAALISSVADDRDIHALSVGIVDRSGLVWSTGVGHFGNRQPADANTRYRAGSLAKLLTAAAVLQLEERGVMDIDQAVSAYLEGFHYRSRFNESGVITARHLLTHHSGLPSDINKGLWSGQRFTELVAQLRDEYVAYPTDFIMNYSNIGYSLLGAAIEDCTGRRFEDHLREAVMAPLGMHNSEFAAEVGPGANLAEGYRNRRRQENLPVRDLPALGLVTSVADLSRFVAAMLNLGELDGVRILDADTVKMMFQPQNLHVALDLDQMIGMPWMLGRAEIAGGGLYAEHSGSMMNYSSQVLLYPELEFGVILLANSGDAVPALKRLSRDIAHTVFSRDRRAPADVAAPRRIPVSKPARGEPSRKQFVASVGLVELDTANASICACDQNRKIDLVSLPDGWFEMPAGRRPVAKRIAERTIDGQRVLVMESNGETRRIGARVQDSQNPFDWRDKFGRYRVINPDDGFPVTDMRLFRDHGVVFLSYRLPRLTRQTIMLPIAPLSETEAITQGLGRAGGETVIARQADGETRLVFSGFVARKISDL